MEKGIVAVGVGTVGLEMDIVEVDVILVRSFSPSSFLLFLSFLSFPLPFLPSPSLSFSLFFVRCSAMRCDAMMNWN